MEYLESEDRQPKDLLDAVGKVRHKNLNAISVELGGPTVLSRIMGWTSSSFATQLTRAHKRVSDKMAKQIEEELGLLPGWLSYDFGSRPSSDISHELKEAVSRALARPSLNQLKAPHDGLDVFAYVFESLANAHRLDTINTNDVGRIFVKLRDIQRGAPITKAVIDALVDFI